MKSFIAKHADKISAVLSCFDRVIIRGHLPMANPRYCRAWMRSKQIGLNLKDLPEGWRNFKEAAPYFAERIKAHAQKLAADAGRPYRHLPSHNEPMEENARALAEQDGITEGLICVYSALEVCSTFRVRFAETGPELGKDLRTCLVLYFYYLDRDFGLMHVKMQTWMPFTVQVYVNGHEWLARQMARQGIAFEKVDNTFVKLEDVARAEQCLPGFWQRDWPRFLDGLAKRVNPLIDTWLAGQNYYWVIDEAELSTDVLFHDRQALADLRPQLYEHAALCFGAEQIMTFLGRKYRETFAGEVKTRWHRREPGGAVRHRVKRNVLKMYDKAGTVLRIETVINQAREFFVHRKLHKQNGKTEVGWFPLGDQSAVANLYRFAQVGQKANERYLERAGGR